MRLLLGLLTLLMLTGAARAELASATVGIPEATVRLIAGHVPGRGDMLGLHFRMHPKWKIYWRSPGDAGFPPVPDWTGSQGVSNLAIEWPLPERFRFYGLETYGYGDEVVLPIRLDRTTSGGHIQLDLFYAACADICVPVTANLSLDLPPTSLPIEPRIKAALSTVPVRSPAGLQLSARYLTKEESSSFVTPRPQGAEHGPTLVVRVKRDSPFVPDLIAEGPEGYLLETTMCWLANSGAICFVRILDQPEDISLVGQDVTFTIWKDDYRVEADVTVVAAED